MSFHRTLIIRKLLLALSLCAATVACASAKSEKLVGGPLVVNVGHRSATVVWVMQDSEVKLGSFPGLYTKISPSLHAEKTSFTNLQPGKKYYYAVTGHDDATGYFKTAPLGRSKFMFVVYGDTRTRHAVHQRVVNAISKTNPDFIIHTGDLVANGKDTAYWPLFFSIEKELLRKTVIYPVLGNHERNSRDFYEFFDLKTPYYSFDWGSAHFTMLNSDVGNAALSEEAKQQFRDEQTRWMEDDLAAHQKADFRFVVMHHPPFTAIKGRQGKNKYSLSLVPDFEKYHVTVAFCGHDHGYQHHLKNGVHYIITGGGGAPLYSMNAPIKGVTIKTAKIENFVRVNIDGAKAHIEAIALDGHLIEKIELGQ